MKLFYLVHFITRENGRVIGEDTASAFSTFVLSSLLLFPLLALIQHYLLPFEWNSYIEQQIKNNSDGKNIIGGLYLFAPKYLIFIPYYYFVMLSKSGKQAHKDFEAMLLPVFQLHPVLVRDVPTYVLLTSMVGLLVLSFVYPVLAGILCVAVLIGFSLALRRVSSS